MRIFDISAPFSPGLPIYGGDPPLKIEHTSLIAEGGTANVSRFILGCHTGTHIDVPRHFIDSGKTISDFPPDHFMGEAVVVEAFGKAVIGKEDIAAIESDLTDRIVLLHTDNGDAMLDSEFREDYVGLDAGAARELVRRGARGIGIDYLSIDSFRAEGHPAHMILLGAEFLVIEGILLTGIPAGAYQCIALPLNVVGGNGCPVRAVLRKR